MAKAKKSREGTVMVLGGGIAGVQAALDLTSFVITSYSIHYTKLYEVDRFSV